MGLSIDEFYKLTPRQFVNIQNGFNKRKEEEMQLQLILNRGLKFTMLLPHLKNQNTTEEKVFPLYFEKQNNAKIDLQKEIEEVENQKINFWSKIDASKGKA